MTAKQVLDALSRNNSAGAVPVGSPTSVISAELMDHVGVSFPRAHIDSEQMAQLAIAAHTVLNMDIVMPLFSVCHEAAAMGSSVDWGSRSIMPQAGKPIFRSAEDIRIPADLLLRPGCKAPLEAIAILKKRLSGAAAVCGKVFGPWTQSYHYFGVENFLIMTLDDPAAVRRILERLLPVTVAFANAQLAAGADCILLADHATRDLCSPQAYRDFVLPLHKQAAAQINGPVMLHICGDTSDRAQLIAQSGLAGFHWDTKSGPPQRMRELAGERLALIGGVSNFTLLRGTPDDIAAQARAAAGAGIDIVGPECAVPLNTPLRNLKAVAAALR